ncbi:WD repeat domain phosphoinositide-interacting protein 3, partial [Thoreauomyces humboldtii]
MAAPPVWSALLPPYSHITLTTPSHWQIHSTSRPPRLLASRQTTPVPRHVALLRDTNIVVLGLGKRKVVVWDESKAQAIWEVECKEEVVSVGVLSAFVVILHKTHVAVYTLAPPPVHQLTIPTTPNPRGLCALSDAAILLPGPRVGHVSITHFRPSSSTTSTSTSTSTSSWTTTTTLIPAHTSAISALALSTSGTLVATASETGTLVRVWRVNGNGSVAGGGGKREREHESVRELRRGVEKARVWSIAFCQFEKAVCVASDTGTVHVFLVDGESNVTGAEERVGGVHDGGGGGSGGTDTTSQSSSPQQQQQHQQHNDAKNRTSILAPLSTYLPKYFSSSWSFAQFSIPPLE